MNFRLLALALLTFSLFSYTEVFAQDDEATTDNPGLKSNAIYLGPVGGYNYSQHTVNLASFAEDPLCPFFPSGSANGFHVGLFYEQPFSATSLHSIVVRGLFNSLPADFTKEGDAYPSLVDDGAGGYKTIISKTSHTVAVAYNMLSFDVMYKFKAFKGIVLTVGPTFDIPLTKTLTQKYKILEPDNAQFKRAEGWEAKGYKYEDNDRTIIVYDKEIPESTGFRSAIKAGIQYEYLTGKKIDIIPGIFYNYAITKATGAEDWYVNALQFSVDIRFAVPSPF